MKKIVIQPISGLANRLRSVASSLVLFPDKEIFCYWGDDLVTKWGSPPFFHERLTYIDKNNFQALTSDINTESRGINKFSKSLYLWHPSGEHSLIPRFMRECADSSLPQIVVRSGGWFGLGSKKELELKRRTVYQELQWVAEVTAVLEKQNINHRYLGLHIRGTDLEQYSPNPAMIERSLFQLSRKLDNRQVYVSADSRKSLDSWGRRLIQKGFLVHQQIGVDFNRTNSEGLISAAVDFLALSRSQAMVYGLTSSFGHEAAIQSTYPKLCRGLYPEKGVTKFVLNHFLNVFGIRERLEAISNRFD